MEQLTSEALGFRHSEPSDLPTILSIYAKARKFMAEQGNPHQWGDRNWPPESLIAEDIARGKSFLCTLGERVVAVFFYDKGYEIEPTYRTIHGAWTTDQRPYGVIHRLASDGSVKGLGRAIIHWALSQCEILRVDTHHDNKVMQNLLESCGFTRCGIIYVYEDSSPRIAYEKVR